MSNYLSDRTGADIDSQLDKADTLLTPASGKTLLHSGNTGIVEFNKPDQTGITPHLVLGAGALYRLSVSAGTTGAATVFSFRNPNLQVGAIVTSGEATSFNTSSDPRLKVFAETPTDEAINNEFSKLYSCFRTFNWKSDLSGDLVWGFDAHVCIDLGTNVGSEGEGPRDIKIGDVYETVPAVTEQRVVLDSEGKPTSEIETIVIEDEINKKVTPAGVDQSKAVPVLLAMIELQKREILAITARLDAANI